MEVLMQIKLSALKYKMVSNFIGSLVLDMVVMEKALDHALVLIEAAEGFAFVSVKPFIAVFVRFEGKYVELPLVSMILCQIFVVPRENLVNVTYWSILRVYTSRVRHRCSERLIDKLLLDENLIDDRSASFIDPLLAEDRDDVILCEVALPSQFKSDWTVFPLGIIEAF